MYKFYPGVNPEKYYFEMGAILLSVAFLAQGCAYGTIINGSRETIGITSNPSGADVSVNGQTIGKTPISTSLPRKQNAIIEFEHDGCQKAQVYVSSTASPLWVASIFPFFLWGLLIGGVIDFSTGGTYYLDPDNPYVSMNCGKK